MKNSRGFTLVEVLVTIVLVSVAIVGVLGGIRAIYTGDARAQTADLLQRLAAEKINDVRILQDPSSNGTSGDFSDRGYSDIRWTLTEDTTSITNADQISVTVTQGQQAQSLTTLLFIRPQTTTAAGSAASSGGSTAAP